MFTVKKVSASGVVMALYVVLMLLTQSFSFGQYQIRIATALYALAAPFPFLIVPLGLANGLSNLLMSTPVDAIGGFAVGILTSFIVYLIRKYKLPDFLIALPVCFVVGLGVPLWLSSMLHVPYWVLAGSLLVGQAVCGVAGVVLVKAVKRFERSF